MHKCVRHVHGGALRLIPVLTRLPWCNRLGLSRMIETGGEVAQYWCCHCIVSIVHKNYDNQRAIATHKGMMSAILKVPRSLSYACLAVVVFRTSGKGRKRALCPFLFLPGHNRVLNAPPRQVLMDDSPISKGAACSALVESTFRNAENALLVAKTEGMMQVCFPPAPLPARPASRPPRFSRPLPRFGQSDAALAAMSLLSPVALRPDVCVVLARLVTPRSLSSFFALFLRRHLVFPFPHRKLSILMPRPRQHNKTGGSRANTRMPPPLAVCPALR